MVHIMDSIYRKVKINVIAAEMLSREVTSFECHRPHWTSWGVGYVAPTVKTRRRQNNLILDKNKQTVKTGLCQNK